MLFFIDVRGAFAGGFRAVAASRAIRAIPPRMSIARALGIFAGLSVASASLASCSKDPATGIEGGWSYSYTASSPDGGADLSTSRFWDFGSEKKFRFWVRTSQGTTCTEGTWEWDGARRLTTTTLDPITKVARTLDRSVDVGTDQSTITDNDGAHVYRRGGLPDGLTCP